MQMVNIANHVTSCANLLGDFAQHLFLQIKHYFLRQNKEEEEDDDDDDELGELSMMTDQSGHHQAVLGDDVIGVVITRLGMSATIGGGGREVIIDELLEEKTASVEELRSAFGVFDKNEDGFISAGELWCVMGRLGFQEGLRLEDCDRMIRAFDDDGDGRVNFDEFTRLMENSL